MVGAGLHALVTAPLVVALVAFHRPEWHPLTDLAQTEMRVRDVGTADSPLVGLAGRIGPWTDPGSHPGPLSFWAMAPVHRLLGGTALAFSAAGLVLHLVAFALVLRIAHRRGGIPLMAGVAAACALLVRAYGAVVFLEPWNPFLPVVWWLAFVLAAWSVVEDGSHLVVAVVAGSFCAQTHLPYLGTVGVGIGALIAVCGYRIVTGSPEERRRRIVALATAGLVGLVLWLPPLIDQVADTHNLGRIRGSLQHPTEPAAGLVDGAREVVDRFGFDYWLSASDGAEVAASSTRTPGGILVLGLWLAAAVACWSGRVGPPSLRRFHAVLAAGVVLAFVSSSRISGERWFYLYFSVMGLAVLCLLATGWTVAAVVAERTRRPGVRRAAVVAPVALAALLSLSAAVAAPSVEPADRGRAEALGILADDTAAALRRADGGTGRYLVRWEDPVGIGAQGMGLVNELERAGLTVGIEEGHRVAGTAHRVMAPGEATAVVVLAVGPAIDGWEDQGARRVALVDPRTAAERDEQEARTARLDATFRAAGDDAAVERWWRNLFVAPLDPDLPPAARAEVMAYLDLPAPAAVFLLPT